MRELISNSFTSYVNDFPQFMRQHSAQFNWTMGLVLWPTWVAFMVLVILCAVPAILIAATGDSMAQTTAVNPKDAQVRIPSSNDNVTQVAS